MIKKDMNNIFKKGKPALVLKTCAASGNLGPGYDVLGLALNIFNTYSVFFSDDGRYHIEFNDKGFADIPEDEHNIIIKAIKKVLNEAVSNSGSDSKKLTERPLRIYADIKIPVKKGLSSSSTAIVAGLLIANNLYGLKLSKTRLLNIGMDFEKHPDGIAASLYGGLVAAYNIDGVYDAKRIDLGVDYKIILFIPGTELETRRAREIVPKMISMEKCVYNISNALLLIESLKRNEMDMALAFIKDSLHQPYRKEIYKESFDLVNMLRDEYRVPSAISGAGPSVIAILNRDKDFKELANSIKKIFPGFKSKLTSICHNGSQII